MTDGMRDEVCTSMHITFTRWPTHRPVTEGKTHPGLAMTNKRPAPLCTLHSRFHSRCSRELRPSRHVGRAYHVDRRNVIAVRHGACPPLAKEIYDASIKTEVWDGPCFTRRITYAGDLPGAWPSSSTALQDSPVGQPCRTALQHDTSRSRPHGSVVGVEERELSILHLSDNILAWARPWRSRYLRAVAETICAREGRAFRRPFGRERLPLARRRVHVDGPRRLTTRKR
mmetsp:Transcript_44478/g.88889  ORF Transcript_44478/g.88889 Transcript_44478/m.88889 type:complete len:228 (-) Transcript_44478:356-1039(-)